HLEDGSPAVADVHDAGVLAGPLDAVRRIRRELLEKGPRALIRTVLAPHYREHSEFGEIQFPAQESDDLLVFLLCQPMLDNKVLGHGDWRLRSHSRRHYEPGRASEHIVHSLWPRAARAGSDVRLRSQAARRRSALGGASGRGYCPTQSAADRKSTRLNSSHVAISYAVFCLKKKKEQTPQLQPSSTRQVAQRKQ